ncbi:extracellular solute-binding protein [Alphaproteobacteria bacterium GH1-50]|uniref:Extracellular solute-binding protein n=1 Tax=Kangsaoukella pontilimi TaxID=2691042 RepID=A0A7C9MJ24_9RHOB|nr:sugar ABC transporter substrate-binding protein [Kangsaoukella pontilimi]MXQ07435.1 extracellular solute-binding protein [Kangsaoukella pontilimi]
MTTRTLKTLLAATALTGIAAGAVSAEDVDYGNFDGYTLRVKLIGGAQYEPLYARISEWEEMTGATVDVLSRKNHFELDREIKQDIAAGTLDWCVGSNHTSFAPQYGTIYTDLNGLIGEATLAEFQELALQNSTVDGRLVQLPRHSDISNLFYKKSLYADEDNKAAFKAEYGYDLAPPETFDQFKDQAIFFADAPSFYGTQYVGKDEAITGRFYEMLVANGGQLFDENWEPTFNSEAGVEAVQWFKDLYDAQAVPAGVLNYLWDDTGLGFASGTVAMNLDWAGWASFFNDPANSKVAGDIGLVRAPKGSGGLRSGWSGSHSFSITEGCDNKDAAASFVTFLTNHDSQMIEATAGLLPTRAKVWDDAKAKFAADGNDFLVEVFDTYAQSMAEDAFTPPLIAPWIEVSNEIWPRLQSAILGEMTAQEALDEAADAARIVMEDAGYL